LQYIEIESNLNPLKLVEFTKKFLKKIDLINLQ